jgi:hypothetical protein
VARQEVQDPVAEGGVYTMPKPDTRVRLRAPSCAN